MGNVFGGCEVILKARHISASLCSECIAQSWIDAVQGAEASFNKRNKVSVPTRWCPGERDTVKIPVMSPCKKIECSSKPWSKQSRTGGWRVAWSVKSDWSLRQGEEVRNNIHPHMYHSYSGLVSLDISRAKCKILEMKQQLRQSQAEFSSQDYWG